MHEVDAEESTLNDRKNFIERVDKPIHTTTAGDINEWVTVANESITGVHHVGLGVSELGKMLKYCGIETSCA